MSVRSHTGKMPSSSTVGPGPGLGPEQFVLVRVFVIDYNHLFLPRNCPSIAVGLLPIIRVWLIFIGSNKMLFYISNSLFFFKFPINFLFLSSNLSKLIFNKFVNFFFYFFHLVFLLFFIRFSVRG